MDKYNSKSIEAMRQFFDQTLFWRYAVSISICKWSVVEAFYSLDLIKRTQFLEEPSKDEKPLSHKLVFYGSEDKVIDTARAVPVGTFSLTEQSYLWGWHNENLVDPYPDSMEWLKSQVVPEREALGQPIFDQLFATDKYIICRENALPSSEYFHVSESVYKMMQLVMVDRLNADGNDWMQSTSNSMIRFVYWFDSKSVIKAYLVMLSYQVICWSKQLLNFELSNGASQADMSAPTKSYAVQVVMAMFRSILEFGSFADWSRRISGDEDSPSLIDFIREVKRNTVFMAALNLHSVDESENEVMKELLGHVLGLARVLRAKTGTPEAHPDDEKILLELLPGVIEQRVD